jgi:hypothetical protein
MKKVKTDKGVFVFLLVTDKAKEVYTSGLFELYKLYDDDSEALVESIEDLNDALEKGVDIGISVGEVTHRDTVTPLCFI